MTVSENEEAIYKQLNKNRLRLYAILSKKINSDTNDFFYKNDGINFYYPDLENLNEFSFWNPDPQRPCQCPQFKNEGNGVVSFLGAVFKTGWENTEQWEMVADIKFGRLWKTGLILLTDANNPFPKNGWGSEQSGRWGISAWERFIGTPYTLDENPHYEITYEGDSERFTSYSSSWADNVWHSLHMKKVSPTRLIVWLDDNENDRIIYDWEELSDIEQITFGATMNHNTSDYGNCINNPQKSMRLYVRDLYVFYPSLPANRLTALCEDTKKIKCSTNNSATIPLTPNLASGNTLAINEFNIHNKTQYCNNVLRYTLRKCGIDFTNEETNKSSNKMNELIKFTNEILTTPTIDIDDIYSAYVNSNDNILFSDSGFETTSSLENKWVLGSAVTRSVGDEGTTLTTTNSTTRNFFQTTSITLTGDWEATVCINSSLNTIYFGLFNNSKTTRWHLSEQHNGIYHMKLVCKNGILTGFISQDNMKTWTQGNIAGNQITTDGAYLFIGNYNNTSEPESFTYKDLKVYKIGTIFPNNKIKELTIDSNADIIFKKGDYTHTYIVTETSGIPDGVTLYLLDENSNQLYSPYDINGNQTKSVCSIISGETDALQLPANYNENQYIDFEVGTYNWKLRYNEGGNSFADKIIPTTVEIRDFDLETNLTPEIYPNEDIQVQLKTYIDTLISLKEFDNDRLTTNASYNDNTGIITYPNSDINDLSLGEHTQIINQKYELNYRIKNPITFGYGYSDTHPCIYSRTIPIIIPQDCTMNFSTPKTNTNFVINDITYKATDVLNINGTKQEYFLKRFPPGSYNLIGTTILNDGNTYSVSGSFNVPTIDCSIILSYDENNVIATYMYNNETPIPNASIQILKDNVVINTLTTNSNGQCTVAIQIGSTYKAQAVDYDNSILLESNNLLVQ